MAINTYNFNSKYIIEEEYFNKDKFFYSDFTYDNLMIAAGGKVRDYTDITELGANYYMASSMTLSEDTTPFYEMLASRGTTNVDTNFVRWRVYGRPERRAISVGNPNNPALTTLGDGGGRFKIQLDVDWFGPQEIIRPANNGRVQVMIDSYPTRTSGGYEYDAVMLADDTFLNPSYLTSGTYWLRSSPGALTSHINSGKAGGYEFGVGFSYVEFQIPLTTFKLESRVDEETHLREGSLRISMCDVDDNIIEDKVTNRLEIEFDKTIALGKEEQMVFGEMTIHHRDRITGEQMTTSPGLLAYLEEGNIRKYNPFVDGIDAIVDMIKTFWYDRIPVSQRNLVLYTGEAGLELWHNWIEERFQGTATMTDVSFILDKTQAFDANKQGFALNNYQFTEYRIQPFGSVRVAHWPMLDNNISNSLQMPGSIYNVASFEFIAMDYGLGQPNMRMVTRPDKMYRKYVNGDWSPLGRTPQGQVDDPNLGDSYKMVHRETFGLVVDDISRLLWFKPAID
jgi:hypothetical protein